MSRLPVLYRMVSIISVQFLLCDLSHDNLLAMVSDSFYRSNESIADTPTSSSTGMFGSLGSAVPQLRSGARASLMRRACASVIKLPKAVLYRGCSTPEKIYCQR